MHIDKIIRTTVGTDDAMERTALTHCRGRLIVPIADLSAILGCSIFRLFRQYTVSRPHGGVV